MNVTPVNTANHSVTFGRGLRRLAVAATAALAVAPLVHKPPVVTRVHAAPIPKDALLPTGIVAYKDMQSPGGQKMNDAQVRALQGLKNLKGINFQLETHVPDPSLDVDQCFRCSKVPLSLAPGSRPYVGFPADVAVPNRQPRLAKQPLPELPAAAFQGVVVSLETRKGDKQPTVLVTHWEPKPGQVNERPEMKILQISPTGEVTDPLAEARRSFELPKQVEPNPIPDFRRPDPLPKLPILPKGRRID